MHISFTDTLTVDAAKKTSQGFLTASVRAARTGIQIYSGREVDPKNEHGLRDRAEVRIYRAEDQVFDKNSLSTLAHKPLTVNHPPSSVTADNWRDYAVGSIGDEIARDGEFIRVPLLVMDAAAIKAIENGKNQLSCGYSCELVFGDGLSPNGEQYDARQTGIVYNHLSVVDAARGGDKLKIIGDAKPMKTILVDGHSVEVSDAAEIAIAGLNKKLADAESKIAAHVATDAKMATDLAAKDTKIATLDAEVATLKAAQVSDADLDKRVEARSKLITDAKKIGGEKLDVTGSNADIKKRAVLARLGDSYKDRDVAFFDAAFELQVASAPAQRDTLRDGIQTLEIGDTLMNDAEKARKARYAHFANAHTGQTEKAN